MAVLYHSEYSESHITFIFSFNRNQACLKSSHLALVVKNLPDNAGDITDGGSIPGWVRSLGGRHGNSLQYPCLGNSMDRGTWWAPVHRVVKSQMRLRWLTTQACLNSNNDLTISQDDICRFWAENHHLLYLSLSPCGMGNVTATSGQLSASLTESTVWSGISLCRNVN